MSPAKGSPSPKGEATRQRIVDAALDLFTEKGFAGTTMRAVAERADVSLGNAYHYFASKEHLVQGFYERTQDAHAEAAAAAMTTRSLAERWTACETAFLEVNRPYHPFAGTFFAVAAQPDSPLSPFSAESGPAREAATAIMRDVVEGSDAKMDARLRAELPDLLWLAHMGIVLHWVHDRSEGQRRTVRLVERTAPALEKLTGLSRLPVLRGSVHDLLDTFRDLRTP
ncbi:TetR/AcrR family transcriptional regulator [Kineococcus rhizosphaerae]|uniref:TetR family transcriptional regulator n=1 Tax=Kineococcus rhizosphaerae TaxID=559628 RepID=A0A2T0R1C8_9ACTN|nr:TetR family transcriptional regulator [Kineococcus rhizosphaerae]PRY13352.1 TetR family transcriptional regulator [Kineococcus rhizosphaerae]